jgi:hypothetical protein
VTAEIGCEGVPRDEGLDQGRACAPVLRARFAAQPLLERLRQRAGLLADGGLRSDLRRHFPHQAEALSGLAVGGRVPEAWLLRELSREAGPDRLVGLAAAAPLLARALEGPLLVRRCAPEGLLRSVEVTRPWLSAALAGVNERGLAVAVAAALPAAASGGAPAWLLAQDCLERFGDLEAALAWCKGRAGSAPGWIALADASGEVAAIEIAAAARRVLRPADGVLLAGSAAGAGADLAKVLRESPPADAAALAARLGAPAVGVDAAARCLAVGGARFTLAEPCPRTGEPPRAGRG